MESLFVIHRRETLVAKSLHSWRVLVLITKTPQNRDYLQKLSFQNFREKSMRLVRNKDIYVQNDLPLIPGQTLYDLYAYVYVTLRRNYGVNTESASLEQPTNEKPKLLVHRVHFSMLLRTSDIPRYLFLPAFDLHTHHGF